MIINQNKWLTHINGYLDALSDISGKQKEFYVRLFLLEKNDITLEEKIKNLLDSQNNIQIVESRFNTKSHIQFFLEKLILFKPFSGLYTNSKKHVFPNEIVKEYQDYIAFHLCDYVDFTLEDENIKYPYESDMNFMLVEENDKLFIVLIQNVKDRELIWVFWQHFYSKTEVRELFLDIEIYSDEKNKKKHTNKDARKGNYMNGLSDEVNQKLASYFSVIQDKGYMEESIRAEFLKYFLEEKVIKIENVLLENNKI